jgi:hypothetical protein
MLPKMHIAATLLIVLAVAVPLSSCVQAEKQVSATQAPTASPVESTATLAATPTPSPTPLNPVVRISPTNGSPGTQVKVTVQSFPPETQVELGVSRENSGYDVLDTLRTDVNGALTTKLVIPTAAEPEERWVVVATTADGTIKAVSPPFEITEPAYEAKMTISPASGPPRTQITVQGEGLPANKTVQLGVARQGVEADTPFEAQTDANGSMTRTLLIPPDAKPGQRWVVVATMEETALEATSNAFEVTEQEYYGTVEISPQSGAPGTLIRIRARDFPPNAKVEIGVGRVNSEYDVVATAQTDGQGRVDTQIKMPPFVGPADDWVIVVEADHRPAKAVSGVFDITMPSPTASPSMSPVYADIYLIAVGDDGQSGKKIGCDDSIVPVEVEIDSTADPLTATLSKLLALENRKHEPSGLYNALHRSDLSVEEVRMTNGEAIVRLSGTLRIGGVCDEPRIRAQLRQTALQYTSVEEVSIIINGTLLEDELGGGEPKG